MVVYFSVINALLLEREVSNVEVFLLRCRKYVLLTFSQVGNTDLYTIRIRIVD